MNDIVDVKMSNNFTWNIRWNGTTQKVGDYNQFDEFDIQCPHLFTCVICIC